MRRRPWISLAKYQQLYDVNLALKYKVPENRPDPRTCLWCHGPLQSKRQKSFCCDDHSKAWQMVFVWERKRAPIAWRILCRDKFTCQDCGLMPVFTNDCGIEHPTPYGLEVHHIEYVEHGGSDHEDNLVTLCKACHLERHGKVSAEARRERSPQIRMEF